MSEFDAIRPYNDDELVPVLDRLLNDNEFLDTVAKLKLNKGGRFIAPLLRPIVKSRLKKELSPLQSVHDLQLLIKSYLDEVLERTMDSLTISGIEHIEKDEAHLFISNHRDITMDPAFVNLALHTHGFSTLRIAIGDNLLTKPFASDLMRLNKSFIVNRSATAPREKLKAAKLLSKYINHSVINDNENVWIAQREGRAKDGKDQTNPAIISMLALSKSKKQQLGEFIESARIVPVSISYEYDPCDFDKARELYKKAKHGSYEKDEHEDVLSIAKGITGYKGKMHLSFGSPLSGEFEDADSVTKALDYAIVDNYVLHTTNCFAYEMLEGKSPTLAVGPNCEVFSDMNVDTEREKFIAHVEQCNAKHRDTLLKGYANPVYGKLELSKP